MLTGRRLAGLGSAAVAAVAMLLLGTITSAYAWGSAPVGSDVHGFGPTDFSDASGALIARCSNEFTGHVTVDGGPGRGGRFSIDDVSFDCQSGFSVTPNGEPWTFVFDDSGARVQGVDIDFTTPQGTCRYSGDLAFVAEQFDGVYSMDGDLTRDTAGCGGPSQMGWGDLTESISANGGRLLTP